ncbi:uncharacterized protein LOC114310233 [Camellia sinensis]|uniref:uncharacterized protein LOC114310233 n=1 Tax=Camellia sinensis TaxID=4442 RepID=UPI001035F9B6|nr:uncharacterized protein LOC114310233 [Camellia sinensis]
MEDKLSAFQKTSTWKLVHLPAGKNLTVVSELGFHLSTQDSALFLLHTSASFVILLLYMDDMIITGSDSSTISEAKYANEVIHHAGLIDTKIADTPIELNVKLNTTDSVPLPDPTLYLEFMGCLIYLTVTRLNLAYDVHVVSQFIFAPYSTHWAALVRILHYLRGAIFQGLLLSFTSSLALVAYVDADWAGNVTDRKSTSGFWAIP